MTLMPPTHRPRPLQRTSLTATLAAAGFVAAGEEADELVKRARGDADLLASLLDRRLAGEPLAWVTGRVTFCGVEIRVDHGVYVPRWQSEELALRAVARLPDRGVAVDLCTGSGAIAAVLAHHRPEAQVVATDNDVRAVKCARANGVAAYHGDLFAPLPTVLQARVDVVVAVVPYVPTAEMAFLPRDTFTHESPAAYDGGPDGMALLRRSLRESLPFLRAGGALLLELGGDQAALLTGDLQEGGFGDITVLVDDEGDPRGVEATRHAHGRVAPT